MHWVVDSSMIHYWYENQRKHESASLVPVTVFRHLNLSSSLCLARSWQKENKCLNKWTYFKSKFLTNKSNVSITPTIRKLLRLYDPYSSNDSCTSTIPTAIIEIQLQVDVYPSTKFLNDIFKYFSEPSTVNHHMALSGRLSKYFVQLVHTSEYKLAHFR